MLSPDEAREIAKQWRPKFIDEEGFDKSWTRFFDMVGDPTPGKLQTWLAKDQAKDEVVHAGIVKEPILPTQSGYDLGDCVHCGGKWFVRRDVPVGHRDFGKAFPCPSCNRRAA